MYFFQKLQIYLLSPNFCTLGSWITYGSFVSVIN